MLNTKEVGWSSLKHEGDANIGFEFETYYVKMELEGVEDSRGVDTKEVLFRDHGFDLTADYKKPFYDLEAVTMPFPGDNGRTWCETAVRMRDVFETMRKRLQDSVDRMLEKEKPSLEEYESYVHLRILFVLLSKTVVKVYTRMLRNTELALRARTQVLLLCHPYDRSRQTRALQCVLRKQHHTRRMSKVLRVFQ